MDRKLISVNNVNYDIVKLLGKGKGGYSYLVKKNNHFFVIKQIHHEPCSYYTFKNKLESEIIAYKRLQEIGILMPKMYEVDYQNERILKEYIDGPIIYDLVKNDMIKSSYVEKMSSIAKMCYANNLNIDYYPTNFVVKNDDLYYVDYEINQYEEKWNFENWGIKYWSKTKDFINTLKK